MSEILSFKISRIKPNPKNPRPNYRDWEIREAEKINSGLPGYAYEKTAGLFYRYR